MKKILLLLVVALPLVFVSCKDDKDEPDVPDNHEYVDLGLPSGTLWATCNVGADNPEESGYFFAWGETEPKDVYDWPYYKWGHWVVDTISDHSHIIVEETWFKYYFRNWNNNSHDVGDGKTVLDPEDDAAYVNWGSKWCMPTLEQFQELLSKCDWQWTERNGVNGQLVTGPNGKSIFFPAAGGRTNRPYNDGKHGYYWSRTLCSRDKLNLESAGQSFAYILSFNDWRSEVWYDIRYDGQSVRAVRASR